jgi:hypothetical protein
MLERGQGRSEQGREADEGIELLTAAPKGSKRGKWGVERGDKVWG